MDHQLKVLTWTYLMYDCLNFSKTQGWDQDHTLVSMMKCGGNRKYVLNYVLIYPASAQGHVEASVQERVVHRDKVGTIVVFLSFS